MKREKPMGALTGFCLLIWLTGCARSPVVPVAVPQIEKQCQKPTEEYLIFTRGPIVPDVIDWGSLYKLQELWAAQLRSCNDDKAAIKNEFD